MTDKLLEIRHWLDNFEMEKARELLRDALKEPTAEIYYLASLAALNETQRVNFLKQALELDPFHKEATGALDVIEGSSQKRVSTASREQQIIQAPQELKQEHTTYVTGKISGVTKVPLYYIPITSGTVRTLMPENAEVIILTRNERVDWFNVVFTSSTNQQLLGWVESQFVSNIGLGGNGIELLDLPVTQYDWNSRDEIDLLIKEKKRKGPDPYPRIKTPTSSVLFIISGCIGISFGLFMFCIGTTDSSPGSILISFVTGGGGLLFLLIGAIIASNNKSTLLESDNGFLDNRYTLAEYKRELQQLKKIKQSMKPESQKLMENQLIMSALQTAMSVGGTIATRVIPDKKDITIRKK